MRAVAVAAAVFACGGGDDDEGGGAGGADAAAAAIDAAGPSIDSAPSPDADLAPDAGGSASLATTIHCGEDACDRDEQICCFTGFPNITTACGTDASCSDLAAHCDGPEDCDPGQICCGDMTGASCKAADQCTGFAAAALCHSDEDCPESNDCHDSKFVPWPIC